MASAEHKYRFQAGDTLVKSRYVVKEQLGYGGFAEVYRCDDIRLGREVTVKVFLRGRIGGVGEAKAAAKLSHPHIVTVHDFHTMKVDGEEVSVITFQYVAGETLDERLRRAAQGLPLNEETIRIIEQTAEALDYAHSRGVVHRDVKPSNILLGDDGKAYLMDFGLAQVKPTIDGSASVLTADLPTGMSGTLPYMAPEQLAGDQVGDERSDLYSFGVTVYEVLTGQLPYYSDQDTTLIAKILVQPPQPPSSVNKDLPPGVDRVLLRALSKKPQERYDTASEFAADLKSKAQKYLTVDRDYTRAVKLVEQQRWDAALQALNDLQRDVPGFRDVEELIKRVESRISRQNRVRELAEKQDYRGALKELIEIRRQTPDYLDRSALEDWQEVLGEAYEQAVKLNEQREFEESLALWSMIREVDPNYSDSRGVEAAAQAGQKRHRELEELYNEGRRQMERGEWEEAGATFRELQQENPGYRDVQAKLAIIAQMAPLAALWWRANESFDNGDFVTCVDRLDELKSRDRDYRQGDVSVLREKAMRNLCDQADSLLQDNKPVESFVVLDNILVRLNWRDPSVDDLARQALDLAQELTLRARLDRDYLYAVSSIHKGDYNLALELWKGIRKEATDNGLNYPDICNVEKRAKAKLCQIWYNKAVRIYKEKPAEAQMWWERIVALLPNYPDERGIVDWIYQRVGPYSRERTGANLLSELSDLIQKHFNKGEVRRLCFDLGVDYDDLSAETKAGKIQELVSYCKRRGRLDELIDLCHSKRPRVSWPDVTEFS